MVSDGLGFFLPPTLAEAAFVYGSGFIVGKGVSGYRSLRGLGKATTVAEVEALDATKDFFRNLIRSRKTANSLSDKQFLDKVYKKADKAIPGKGPRADQQKHKYAERLLKKYKDTTGNKKNLHPEKRFHGGEAWEPGDPTKGSKIVGVWDSRRQIPYDYKFGGARVTPRDRVEYAGASKESKKLSTNKTIGR